MSYLPGDEYLEGVVSNCCGARVIIGDLCADCKDHCGSESEEPDEENKDREFSPDQKATIERMEEEARLEELEMGAVFMDERNSPTH